VDENGLVKPVGPRMKVFGQGVQFRLTLCARSWPVPQVLWARRAPASSRAGTALRVVGDRFAAQATWVGAVIFRSAQKNNFGSFRFPGKLTGKTNFGGCGCYHAWPAGAPSVMGCPSVLSSVGTEKHVKNSLFEDIRRLGFL